MNAIIRNGKYNDGKFKSDNFATLFEWVLNGGGNVDFDIVSTEPPFKGYICSLSLDKDCSRGEYKDTMYSIDVELNIFDPTENHTERWTLFVNSGDFTFDDAVETVKENFLKDNLINQFMSYRLKEIARWHYKDYYKEKPEHQELCLINQFKCIDNPYKVMRYDSVKDRFYDTKEYINYSDIFSWCYFNPILGEIEKNTPHGI